MKAASGHTTGDFSRSIVPAASSSPGVSEGTKGVESVVLFALQPKANQTEVTLRHSGVPDDELGHRHKEGWTWVLSMLDECLTKGKLASPLS
ncbi:MAG TPA: SRPBCC domain-containing protein [Planctomycetaceae bacterium]|nr:SRPBCC domain-containing protein [Planctomycetaceae bacterium]